MISSWIFNVLLGIASFLAYFLLSITNKTVTRSLIESLIVGIIFFCVAYLFRWAISFVNQNVEVTMDNVKGNQDSAIVADEVKRELGTVEKMEEVDEDNIEKTSKYIKELIKD